MKVQEKDLYKIKRVTLKDKEVIGVIHPGNGVYSKYVIETLSGDNLWIQEGEIQDIKIVRNIPSKLRLIMEDRTRLQKKIREERNEFEEMKRKMEKKIRDKTIQAEELRLELAREYLDKYKIYNSKQFVEVLEDYMRDYRKHISDSCFDNIYFTNKDTLLVSVTVETKKYANEGDYGLVYQEYDGSMHIFGDREDIKKLVNKLYRKSLSDIEKKLNGRAKLIPNADIGDKNRFILSIDAFIPIKDTSESTLDDVKDIISTII